MQFVQQFKPAGARSSASNPPLHCSRYLNSAPKGQSVAGGGETSISAVTSLHVTLNDDSGGAIPLAVNPKPSYSGSGADARRKLAAPASSEDAGVTL